MSHTAGARHGRPSNDLSLSETLQAVLFFRLGYPAAKWRNVYKGLTVLDFLLKRGSDQARAVGSLVTGLGGERHASCLTAARASNGSSLCSAAAASSAAVQIKPDC